MSGFHSDSDDYGDDLIILASQGLLSNQDCVVVLSPILGVPDGKRKENGRHRVSRVGHQTKTKAKPSLSKSTQNKSSRVSPITNRQKDPVQNAKGHRSKPSKLSISKALFSNTSTKDKETKKESEKLDLSLHTRKEVKEKRSKIKKLSRKSKSIFDQSESSNDSSDLEDPSIILKEMTTVSQTDNSIINETLSEDDLMLNMEDGEKTCDIDSYLAPTNDSLIKSGPRHSSPIKKRKKIFDRIRKENARNRPSQESVLIVDSDSDFDFSQSFIKCTQEQSRGKETINKKKNMPKKPLLSLKTAAVPTTEKSPSSSDLEDPSVNLKRSTSRSQNITHNANKKNSNRNVSDEDLFAKDEDTEFFIPETPPELIKSKKSCLMDIGMTIEHNIFDADTEEYCPDVIVEPGKHIQSAIQVGGAPIASEGSKNPDEKDYPILAKLVTSDLKRKDTISYQVNDEVCQKSQPFLTVDISSTTDTSMPELSPHMSVVIKQDLSSDTSLPQLSQYISDVTPPKMDKLKQEESIPKLDAQLEKSNPALSFYSLENDIVAVFDSEDEELFMTQSAIDRSNETEEVIVKEEELSEEEMRMNQENKLFWDDKSTSKELREAKIKVSGQNYLLEDGTGGKVQHDNGDDNIKPNAFENKISEDDGNDSDNEDNIDDDGDDDDDDDDDEDFVLDSAGNKCYTVKLNIFRQPTLEDFKHILCPEKSLNDKVKRSTDKRRSKSSNKIGNIKKDPTDLHGEYVNKDKDLPSSDASTTAGLNVGDSSNARDRREDIGSTDVYSLPTQIYKGKEEPIFADDDDDDVYLAQTQIDYLVISSDEESNDEVKEVGGSPVSSPSTVDPNDFDTSLEHLNDVDNGLEPVCNFESDIDVFELKSVKQIVKCESDNSNNNSDIYMMATQVVKEEKDTVEEGGTESDYELYMIDTQMDETVLDVKSDGSKIAKEVKSPSTKSDAEDADNTDAYLMDTLVDIDSSMETDEVDPYAVATQNDLEPDIRSHSSPEDPYGLPTLEIDRTSPELFENEEELLKDTTGTFWCGEEFSDEEELLRENDDSLQSDTVTKTSEFIGENNKEVTDNDTCSTTEKSNASNASPQNVSQKTQTRLVSKISEDADVSENNIVEYMMSTQNDPTIAPRSRENFPVPSGKSWNVSKLPTVTKGLFDKLLEPSSTHSEGRKRDDKLTLQSSKNERSLKPKVPESRRLSGKEHEVDMETSPLTCPKSQRNIFSHFLSDSSHTTIDCHGKGFGTEKEIDQIDTTLDKKRKENDKNRNKDSRKRVSARSDDGTISSESPPLKRSEANKNTKVIPPKWMSSAKEKFALPSQIKPHGHSTKDVRLKEPSKIRKRKNSNKNVEESLTSGIAIAKKKAIERRMMVEAAPRQSDGKDKQQKQPDLSDVEMPSTQEMMEQGLPILNKNSLVVKRAKNLPDVTSNFSLQKTPSTTSSTSSSLSSSLLNVITTTSLSPSLVTEKAKSLKTLTTSVWSLSTSSLSSPVLGMRSQAAIQQSQKLPSVNQEGYNQGGEKPIVKRLPSLSKSIDLHKDDSNKDKNSTSTSLPSNPLTSMTNQEISHEDDNTSTYKIVTLSKSIYLSQDNSNSNDSLIPVCTHAISSVPNSLSIRSPTTGLSITLSISPVQSSSSSSSLSLSTPSPSNSQPAATSHSASSKHHSTWVPPVALPFQSNIKIPVCTTRPSTSLLQSSLSVQTSVKRVTSQSVFTPSIGAHSSQATQIPTSLSINTPCISTNPSIITSSLSNQISQKNPLPLGGTSSPSTTTSLPTRRASFETKDPSSTSSIKPPVGMSVLTVLNPTTEHISTTAGIIPLPPGGTSSPSTTTSLKTRRASFETKDPSSTSSIKTPVGKSVLTVLNPTTEHISTTAGTLVETSDFNSSSKAQFTTSSSTKPTLLASKAYGIMIRKPKQALRGILKTGKQPRMSSLGVHFDETKNTVNFIEKVKSKPPLMHFDSTTKKICKEPFRTQNQYIQAVLKWNTSWIIEQEKVKGHPPPIIEPGQTFNMLRMSYDDVRDYQEITYKLFLLEVWAMLSSNWNNYPQFLPAFIKSKPQSLSAGDEKLGLITMEVEGVTRDVQTIPFVSDVLVLAMKGKFKGGDQDTVIPFEQFGFVECAKKSRLEHNRNSVLYRPEIKEKFREFMKPGAWIFSVTIRVRHKGLVPFDLMKLRRVTSLTTALRQFQGLVEFAQIPLCPSIINPDPLNPVFCQDESYSPDDNLLKYLNKEQAYAVTQIREAVLSYPNHPRVCLLQGPPGTGKSFAIMVLIHQILLNSRFQAKICLAAPSNAAVDEMANRIIELSEKKCKPRGSPPISLVRLGNPDSVSSSIKKYHIWSLMDELLCQGQKNKLPKSLQDELKAVDSRISSLTTELKDIHISEAQKVAKRKELSRLQNQDKKRLEHEMAPSHEDRRRAKYSVINNCHVICGTLSSFGSGEVVPLLRFKNTNHERREPFTCLIVDEATQAVEMDCLIPLQHSVSKLVLVGDQEQLPATVCSQEAKNFRFDVSLFQRLHNKFDSCKEEAPNPVMMLKEQYRMHPEILKLPNSYFYKDLLMTAQSCVQSRASNLSPYLVFDILDGMEMSGSSGSKSNKKEATCVALLCQRVVNLMTKKNDSHRQKKIGVICPYSDQKRAIQDSLGELGLYNILVNTVDSFQGQEKDVIILSCVRAQGNPQTVGFVDDSKRMNVALTRAKLALYVVGHGKTLGTSDLWKLLFQDAKNRGLLVTVPKTDMFSRIAYNRVPLISSSHRDKR